MNRPYVAQPEFKTAVEELSELLAELPLCDKLTVVRDAIQAAQRLRPEVCQGCGKRISSCELLVRIGGSAWTCETCDGVVKNDSQRSPPQGEFRSSNTGTLSHFETETPISALTVISPEGGR